MKPAKKIPTAELRTQTLDTLRKILPANAPQALPAAALASALGVKPQTLHRSLCVNGHYLGLVPERLPNGRLIFVLA